MHINKLAILLAAAASPTAHSGLICPGKCPHQTRCYSSSTSLLELASHEKRELGHSSSPPPPAANPGLRRGDMRNLRATVINYEAESRTLARDEVVKAVEDVITGDKTDFQLNVMMGDTLKVLRLQNHGMTVSHQNLKEKFTLVNAFIEDSDTRVSSRLSCK
jgi:hypothetical protein